MKKHRISIVILLLFFSGCIGPFASAPRRSLSSDETFILVQKKVGGSSLYLFLPLGYSVNVSNGPDFTVYYFYYDKNDTTREYIGSAGMYLGDHPSAFGEEIKATPDMAHSLFMNNLIDWKVYPKDGGYLMESIFNKWDEAVHLFVNTKNREDLAKFREIFATMHIEG